MEQVGQAKDAVRNVFGGGGKNSGKEKGVFGDGKFGFGFPGKDGVPDLFALNATHDSVYLEFKFPSMFPNGER